MREEKLKKLLNELANTTPEPVRTGLAQDIKDQIPHRLITHRGGMDTINTIIDLRISKLITAAVIIITIVLCVHFLGGRDAAGSGIYEDIMYWRSWIALGRNNLAVGREKYEHLAQQGKQVWFYGDSIDYRGGQCRRVDKTAVADAAKKGQMSNIAAGKKKLFYCLNSGRLCGKIANNVIISGNF